MWLVSMRIRDSAAHASTSGTVAVRSVRQEMAIKLLSSIGYLVATGDEDAS